MGDRFQPIWLIEFTEIRRVQCERLTRQPEAAGPEGGPDGVGHHKAVAPPRYVGYEDAGPMDR
jgi:hypothetical protein